MVRRRPQLLDLAIAVMVVALAIAVALPRHAHGDSAPVDLGETNVPAMACDLIRDATLGAGLHMRHCRVASADVKPTKILLKLNVATDSGKFVFEIHYRKTLWSLEAIEGGQVG